MPQFRAPRGTRDLLPDARAGLGRLETLARSLMARYGYREMEIPLFEQTAVFERGIGETTDVVEKELFRLAPRTEDSEAWALRPEATAGIVRAYVQHGMQTLPQPVKLSVMGPMFRYDRPQAGRYRQFWQWDAEAIGDGGPAVDAEVIEMGWRFYVEAGLPNVQVLVSSIGDSACRPQYLAALKSYFRGHEASLAETEKRRLETNPLRLLDSKDPVMAPLIAAAPTMADSLCDACRAHFDSLLEHLDPLGVPYRLEPTLVRGLDYYARTAFEYYRHGAEGQQQALGGGGRYDGLIELLGGRPTPAIGFALGLDRVLLALEETGATAAADAPILAVIAGADPADTGSRLRLASMLRAEGLAVRAELANRKLGRQLETASRDHAHFAVIIGDELADGHVQLKDLEAGTQRLVALTELAKDLARAQKSHHHG